MFDTLNHEYSHTCFRSATLLICDCELWSSTLIGDGISDVLPFGNLPDLPCKTTRTPNVEVQ